MLLFIKYHIFCILLNTITFYRILLNIDIYIYIKPFDWYASQKYLSKYHLIQSVQKMLIFSLITFYWYVLRKWQANWKLTKIIASVSLIYHNMWFNWQKMKEKKYFYIIVVKLLYHIFINKYNHKRQWIAPITLIEDT